MAFSRYSPSSGAYKQGYVFQWAATTVFAFVTVMKAVLHLGFWRVIGLQHGIWRMGRFPNRPVEPFSCQFDTQR